MLVCESERRVCSRRLRAAQQSEQSDRKAEIEMLTRHTLQGTANGCDLSAMCRHSCHLPASLPRECLLAALRHSAVLSFLSGHPASFIGWALCPSVLEDIAQLDLVPWHDAHRLQETWLSSSCTSE